MKKILLPLLLFLIAVSSWFLVKRDFQKKEDLVKDPILVDKSTNAADRNDRSSIGVEILKDYGSESSSLREDIKSVSHLLENFDIILKGNGEVPLGSNGDFVDALRGKNPKKIKMLKDGLPFISGDGEFLDRFGTSLFFHVEGQDEVELRSAGPDRELWTDDDEHLSSDGSFLNGEELMKTTLNEGAH